MQLNKPEEEIIYHKASTDADIETVAAMRLEFTLELSGDLPDPDIDSLRQNLSGYFKRTTRDQTCISFIATVGGAAAGIGTIHLRDMPGNFRNPSGKWAYVMNMYTRPAFRKRGICAGILNRLVEEGRKHGYKAFELHATPAGQPVYISNGFEIYPDPTLRRIL